MYTYFSTLCNIFTLVINILNNSRKKNTYLSTKKNCLVGNYYTL